MALFKGRNVHKRVARVADRVVPVLRNPARAARAADILDGQADAAEGSAPGKRRSDSDECCRS